MPTGFLLIYTESHRSISLFRRTPSLTKTRSLDDLSNNVADNNGTVIIKVVRRFLIRAAVARGEQTAGPGEKSKHEIY